MNEDSKSIKVIKRYFQSYIKGNSIYTLGKKCWKCRGLVNMSILCKWKFTSIICSRLPLLECFANNWPDCVSLACLVWMERANQLIKDSRCTFMALDYGLILKIWIRTSLSEKIGLVVINMHKSEVIYFYNTENWTKKIMQMVGDAYWVACCTLAMILWMICCKAIALIFFVPAKLKMKCKGVVLIKLQGTCE